jgi:hypothetical protein
MVLQYLHRRLIRPIWYSNIYTGEWSELYGTPISTQVNDQTYMVLQYLHRSDHTYMILQYLHRRMIRPIWYSNIYTGEWSDLYGTPISTQESDQTYMVLQYLHRRVIRPLWYSNIYTGEWSDLYGTPISTQENDQTYMVLNIYTGEWSDIYGTLISDSGINVCRWIIKSSLLLSWSPPRVPFHMGTSY